ncbi:MAG: tRNA lysidine(34) synthetase TilS [Puniceicoccaceae bacterium]|nr:MAG: tRNA lysidine(34) synthetase TilS [Puniceicoccaceae bacterium]
MADTPKPVNWPEAARALLQRFDDRSIEPSVLAYLAQLPEAPARRILVACSGGADSVCLLCLLAARAGDLGLSLIVAHYNHAWRDADSEADAEFVAALAQALGLSYVSGKRPANEAAFTETTARALRLEFLRQSAAKHRCAAIAFGHQLDDVIETQLQRLARGCGTDGLAAPRPVAQFPDAPTHLRPLLHLRAGDIRMSLNASSIPWREDLSNQDVSIARNALRKQIIPDLTEALGRDASLGAARSRRLLEEDAAALDALARERLPEAYAHAPALSRAALRAAPLALCRRALATWLHGHGLIGSVSPPAMDLLIEAIISSRRRHRMSAGAAFLVLDASSLVVNPGDAAEAPVDLQAVFFEAGESVILSTGAVIESEQIRVDKALRQRIDSGAIDPSEEAFLEDAGEGGWQIRRWQPGDRFRPLGAPGGKKLKDWFIDRRIPAAERKTLPLVINAAGEVVWVPGFPPAESCKIKPSTKQALRLTYQASNPI